MGSRRPKFRPVVAAPDVRRLDPRIVHHVRVRREADVEEDRHRFGRPGGEIDEQVEGGSGTVVVEVEGHLAAGGPTIERRRPGVEDVEDHLRRAAWTTAVLVLLEEADQLGPALLHPQLGVAHRGAVLQHQRIGERVRPHRRLGVVDGDVRHRVRGRVRDLRRHRQRAEQRKQGDLGDADPPNNGHGSSPDPGGVNVSGGGRDCRSMHQYVARTRRRPATSVGGVRVGSR